MYILAMFCVSISMHGIYPLVCGPLQFVCCIAAYSDYAKPSATALATGWVSGRITAAMQADICRTGTPWLLHMDLPGTARSRFADTSAVA